ncbi:D-tyrosyl-tRNA(Tyr) deacylase [Lasiodiplodia hormozganensis]|uniref:D-aminoacyl-tRNA deacylase n=2 Tax=Lasiodiplodia TaxID=66739 RepID=A0A5N5D0B2_9PEZI|nr:D-tyrosyl-tRNA(Tyr) deacylase [Lasiodiplodia theobromae]KAK0660574.1 D-tyrosyl-tRNA(Tyr) deacylase [Lasiodiplodia hormozganensis]
MKAVLQRVKSASVTVDGNLISSIGKGVLVFVGVGKEDTPTEAEKMAGKVLSMQLWDDDQGGKWKRNVKDVGGEVLCVSQFTLLASTKKGKKPSFHRSAPEQLARDLYSSFFKKTKELYQEDRVKDGIFQAMMDVALVNDGPVGLDYRCEDEAVTIEIDMDPPKMDIPGVSGMDADKVKLEDLMTKIGRIQKEFNIPAELLQ